MTFPRAMVQPCISLWLWLGAASAAAAAPGSDGTVHEFLYRAAQPVHKVDVAGTFNNWNQSANPLTPQPDGRTWSVRLKLPYGRVQYKFVIDGAQWVLDPMAPSLPDGNGNTNSVVLVLPPDYDRPASPSDWVIAASALRHEPQIPDLNYDRGRLRFHFRARPDDLSAVFLRVNRQRLSMAPVSKDDLYETYEAHLNWDRKTDLDYDFELHDGSTTARFGAEGLVREPSPLEGEGRVRAPGSSEVAPFHLVAKSYRPFNVPSWVDNSVIYQIFPDRFANGDPRNDPPDVQPWGAKPTYRNFFGGDATGVRQHLDYLAGLGIKAVYFNPVFKSPSNHRYETTDYLQIDPRFGTNQEFGDLTRSMQAKGIRTVMDFAFNHTAPDFFAFKDIREKGRESAFTDWYWIKSYPVTVKENPPYVAWFNYPSMPKLNVMNPAAHAYVLNAVDFWERNATLSGIRLDVANEVDPQMWRDLRTHLKSYAPDTWIVGEEWGDANPWLTGDQWDSTMGYQFREACLDFFAESATKPSEFVGRLMSVYDSYAPQVSRNLMNLLGSHDTPRFLTLCHGDRDLLLLAATVEFTWPGAPTIYYGDELGMTGDRDPDNRRCMEWDRATADNPVLAYYKRLIKIRTTIPAFCEGDPQVLYTNDETRTFAYARTVDNHLAAVAVNASEQPQTVKFQLPTGRPASDFQLIDLISGQRVSAKDRTVSLRLPPRRAAVLVPAGEPFLSSFLPTGTKTAARSFSFGHRSPSHSQGASK